MNITVKDGRAYNDKGEVGVLVSAGFGAGWSTWNNDIDPFDPHLIVAFSAHRTKGILAAQMAYPQAYHGGLDQATVEWLPKGTRFYIDEYDGHETIVTLDYLVLEA